MTLAPQLLGTQSTTSLPRVILATAAVTTAVFAAGLVTGAALMRVPRTIDVEAPPARAFATPPPPVVEAPPAVRVTVPSVPALPRLGWTATAQRGAVDPSLQWAATLFDASSEYTTTSWSAAQVLGAPDVYPQAGDHTGAWASKTADDQREVLEVGFDHPARIDAVHVLETYNPGAVGKVEAIDADGRTVVLFAREAAWFHQLRTIETGSAIRVVAGACTPFPVSRVRVTLDSQFVTGWNEVDAIGIRACRD